MGAFVLGAILVFIAAPIGFFVARSGTKRLMDADLDRYAKQSAKTARAVGNSVAIGSFLLGILIVAWSCVTVVPVNSVGIPTKFGSIGNPMNSGFHVVAPWTDVNTFSTRIQESSMLGAADEGDKAKDDSIEVRGSDGYLMHVDVTVRYFIQSESASSLFRLVGSEDGIRERLVRPEVREAIRVAFAGYTSEEGYTTGRDAIRSDATADLAKRLERYGLKLDSIAIRNVAPDATLGKAISERAAAREKKLQAEIDQERLVTEAETRRKVAETDAAAKQIAAEAEAEANRTIAASITEDLLMLKRIEALRDANTVYVPDGSSVIVGNK